MVFRSHYFRKVQLFEMLSQLFCESLRIVGEHYGTTMIKRWFYIVWTCNMFKNPAEVSFPFTNMCYPVSILKGEKSLYFNRNKIVTMCVPVSCCHDTGHGSSSQRWVEWMFAPLQPLIWHSKMSQIKFRPKKWMSTQRPRGHCESNRQHTHIYQKEKERANKASECIAKQAAGCCVSIIVIG